MSFGDGNLHAQVAQLKTENARLKQQLDAMPGIVRCRDCRYYHSYQDLCERLRPGMVVMGDGFCAWACRKGGGDD